MLLATTEVAAFAPAALVAVDELFFLGLPLDLAVEAVLLAVALAFAGTSAGGAFSFSLSVVFLFLELSSAVREADLFPKIRKKFCH